MKNLSSNKILITGTAGFIGFHLASRLIADGYLVVGLDIINVYYDVNLKYNSLDRHGVIAKEIYEKSITQSS